MITRLNPANEAQGAMLRALKADAALVALIPASRIYPQKVPNKPKRPFVKLGVPVVTPRKVDGGDAADIDIAVHCFVSTADQIPDPRAFSMNVASHVLRILDGMDDVDLGQGMELEVYVGQAQTMQEDDADHWHSFVTVRAEAA